MGDAGGGMGGAEVRGRVSGEVCAETHACTHVFRCASVAHFNNSYHLNSY